MGAAAQLPRGHSQNDRMVFEPLPGLRKVAANFWRGFTELAELLEVGDYDSVLPNVSPAADFCSELIDRWIEYPSQLA